MSHPLHPHTSSPVVRGERAAAQAAQAQHAWECAQQGRPFRVASLPDHVVAPPGMWLVAATSGSTAQPRLVARTWQSWADSFDSFSVITGIDSTSRVLVPGPVESTLYLFGAMHAYWSEAQVSFGSFSGAAISEGVTGDWTHAHLVPAQLATLVERRVTQGLDSPAHVIVAGAALDPALATRAIATGLQVTCYYGATELSLVAIGRPGQLRPFDRVQVEVVAETLWVSSPYLASYVHDRADFSPEDGADAWRPLESPATVGDRARIESDGTVTLSGRGSSVITTGGSTALAEDVEAALLQFTSINEAVVVGLPHDHLGQVVAAVVVLADPADPTVTASALRELAAGLLSADQRPRQWFVATELPQTPTGKPQRAAIAAGLRDGTLAVRRLG